MNGVRQDLEARATGLADPALTGKLRAASAAVDDLRKKIVATKEGGMITGEERLRENLVELYGSVNGYEGRPAATQVGRTTAIARELGEVSKQFDLWLAKELAPLNTLLAAQRLPPIGSP
jgi:hypothetical protein